MIGDLIFLGITALTIVFFLTLKPTSNQAVIVLELNPNDAQLISDSDMAIAENELRNK